MGFWGFGDFAAGGGEILVPPPKTHLFVCVYSRTRVHARTPHTISTFSHFLPNQAAQIRIHHRICAASLFFTQKFTHLFAQQRKQIGFREFL